MRTILITGASGGLGLAIAVQSARAGYKVYTTMRNTAKRGDLDLALAAEGLSAEVRPLGVDDSASIAAAVDHIQRSDGRIDVRVNNAGMGFARSLEQATEADIDRVLDVNPRGVMRCTKAVPPHMRAARRGHVITISSVGGLVGQPFNEVYSASKFAVEGFMESLASYVGPAFGLHFTCVEPGGIASGFAATAMKQIEASSGLLDDEYKPILNAYMTRMRDRAAGGGSFQSADQVAAVVMACLANPAPPVRIRTSDAADPVTTDCALCAPPVRSRTSDAAEALCALKTAADPDGLRPRDFVHDRFLRP